VPAAGVSVPAEAVQGLARHNVKEFTRFGDFLPRIYQSWPRDVLLEAPDAQPSP